MRRIFPFIAALALSSISHAEGELDLTFAQSGSTTLPFSSGGRYDSLVLPDGKIVVSATLTSSFTPEVVRLLADGTRDAAFGNQGNGVSRFDMSPFGAGSSPRYSGFTVSPDGSRIYLTGRVYDSTAGYLRNAILAVDSNGQLDTTFGTNGLSWTGPIVPVALITDPDGSLVVLQEQTLLPATSSVRHSRGSASLPLLAPDSGTELKYRRLRRSPDGGYYVLGETFSSQDVRMVVIRVSPNGAVDQAFGGAGILYVDFQLGTAIRRTYLGDIAVQSDGKLIVIGTARTTGTQSGDPRCGISRFTVGGQLDTTFGNSGTRALDIPGDAGAAPGDTSCMRVVVRPDGRFLVVGDSSIGGYTAGLKADGSTDTNYGNNGVAMYGRGYGAVLDQAGRLLVTADQPSPRLTRLTSNDGIFADGFDP